MRPLEEPYRGRAIPPGSARYWSWLFAAGNSREPLLSIYALTAEWRALSDPASDPSVAETKLLWWREEIRRLAAGTPVHPITRHIAGLPDARFAGLSELDRTIEATAAEVAGVPLERSAELDAHAWAVHGIPLMVAAHLSAPAQTQSGSVGTCSAALASAEYLCRSLRDYRRYAGRGRVPFPVDSLLAAGIDNADLGATEPPPRLAGYLDTMQRQAAAHFAAALTALAPPDRPALRHLAVLAALGARHLHDRDSAQSDFHFADLYNAWNAARRAVAGR